MSVADDLRKVLQDFLAPELRAMNARLDAVDSRLEAIEKVIAAQHRELLARLDGLQKYFELDTRVERLEGREPRA